MPSDRVTYDRPVEATLVVRLDNGDEWEAKPEDLERFTRDMRLDIYTRTEQLLREAFGIEAWDGEDALSHIRYVVECGILYKHTPWANEAGEPWPRDEDDESPSFKESLRAGLAEWGGVSGGEAPDAT